MDNKCTIYIYRQTHKYISRKEYRRIVSLILKAYLGLKFRPDILFDKCGKPYVDDKYGIDFNYSHSSTCLALAIVSKINHVGIDTEPLDRECEIEEIRRIAFSSEELRLRQVDSYVSRWCLKEAAVKMYGRGFLDADPREFTCTTQSNSTLKLAMRGEIIARGFYKIFYNNYDAISVCSTGELEDLDLITINLLSVN
jgi:phosphopantetheinyl transferase